MILLLRESSSCHQIQRDLPCSWSDPKGNLNKKHNWKIHSMHYKDPYVFMFPGAKVEPVMVEDINFYKANFGKEPPHKKVKPSPSVTEKHYGIDNLTKLKIEQQKINLKRNIYLAIQGNSLPPIYHILGNKTDNHPSVEATHELPHIMEADDINIVYSHEIEVETEEENTESMISLIKNHPAYLHDILFKAESIMERIRVDDEKARKIEECT